MFYYSLYFTNNHLHYYLKNRKFNAVFIFYESKSVMDSEEGNKYFPSSPFYPTTG